MLVPEGLGRKWRTTDAMLQQCISNEPSHRRIDGNAAGERQRAAAAGDLRHRRLDRRGEDRIAGEPDANGPCVECDVPWFVAVEPIEVNHTRLLRRHLVPAGDDRNVASDAVVTSGEDAFEQCTEVARDTEALLSELFELRLGTRPKRRDRGAVRAMRDQIRLVRRTTVE